VLQAGPGRGFWQGNPGQSEAGGTLSVMVQQMSGTRQPSFLSHWVGAFAGFDAGHGWAVNLFCVAVLAIIGVSLLSARWPRIVGFVVIAGIVVCLADWVLV